MSFTPRDLLLHMQDETTYLLVRSEGLTMEMFLLDETLRRAYLRSLEIIGEAASRLPDDWRRNHPQVEWRAIVGMRNRLIHGYFGVDYDLVWQVVERKIPILHDELGRMLGEWEVAAQPGRTGADPA